MEPDDDPQDDPGRVSADEPSGYNTETPQLYSPLDGTNALAEAWSWTEPGYTTDAVEVGVSPGGQGYELIVLMEGTGNYCGADPIAPGELAILDTDGIPRTTYLAGGNRDLMGVPLAQDIDGDGDSEYIVCESAHQAPCRALDSNLSSTVWATGDAFCAGSWNMGPSAGNVVTGNSGDEVVIPDWNGDVLVLDRASGTTLSSVDIYANGLQEWTNGHAAIVDMDGSNGDEIVIEGGRTGRVIVLKDNGQGALNVLYASDSPPGGAYADGSGPAVGDIDGDGQPEIVVVVTGSPAIYAYSMNHGTGCKYSWSAPAGADYHWTSPVIGDLDGDGSPEIAVFSNNGILSVLSAPTAQTGVCKTGVVEWQYTVSGGGAWFTPALGQMVGGDGLDVVVASYTMLQVVDVEARDVGYWFEDVTADFYPSVSIVPGPAQAGAPGAHLFTPGWGNGVVSRLDTPADTPRPNAWLGFMGGPSRTGAR